MLYTFAPDWRYRSGNGRYRRLKRRSKAMADDFELDTDDLNRRMDGAMNALKQEFLTLRTGRASLSILDPIKVDYYGTLTPMNQMATLAVPESRLITIQPWDVSVIKDIEKVNC